MKRNNITGAVAVAVSFVIIFVLQAVLLRVGLAALDVSVSLPGAFVASVAGTLWLMLVPGHGGSGK